MKILVIQTAFIGDVILATALLEKIHESIPHSEIDFLVRKGNEGLLKEHPLINDCIVFNKKGGKYRNLIKLIRKIRGKNYDYVINAQRFFTTGLITVLSGAKKTIGFNKNPLSFLFSTSVEHIISAENEGEVHEIDRNNSLIKSITDGPSKKPRLYPTKNEFESVQKYKSETYICIAPTSVWFTKQFPRNKWIEFLNRVDEDLKVYLLGAPSDKEDCETLLLATKHNKIENLSGQLGLLASAALMRDAKMNYVNDSAPMHLASAMNAPVCAVYCSTIPQFGFGPLSDKSYVIENTSKLDCRPCGLHGHRACPQNHFKCAQDIDVDQLARLLD